MEFQKYYDIQISHIATSSPSVQIFQMANRNPEFKYEFMDGIVEKWTDEQKYNFLQKIFVLGYTFANIVIYDSHKDKKFIVLYGINEAQTLYEFFNDMIPLSGMWGEYDVHGKTYSQLPFPVKRTIAQSETNFYRMSTIGEFTPEEMSKQLYEMHI